MIDLKRFRRENKIQQAEVCKVLSIKQPYLSAIENGKRPLNSEHVKLFNNHYGDIIANYKQSFEINDRGVSILKKPDQEYGTTVHNHNTSSNEPRNVSLMNLEEKVDWLERTVKMQSQMLELMNEKLNRFSSMQNQDTKKKEANAG